MSKKIRVGIIFGGRSAEHEISLLSAKNVYEALDKNKYEPILIGIDKKGRWGIGRAAEALLESGKKLPAYEKAERQVALVPGMTQKSAVEVDSNTPIGDLDVIFPVLHGTYGEDGTVQGMFKLLDIPYVGADVLGSSIGMDKDVAKRLLRDAGVSVAPFYTIRRGEGVDGELIIGELGLPLFVKPANAGSSVGVHKVKDQSSLMAAIEDALLYDNKVLVESAIVGREIECGILGNEKLRASVPSEIIPAHEFYSYEAKYMDENGAKLETPARVTPDEQERIQETAIKTARVLGIEGMVRVDFFLTKDGEVIFNEVNTIPGFTKISQYPTMWKETGISYPQLVDELITLALERHKRDQKLKTTKN